MDLNRYADVELVGGDQEYLEGDKTPLRDCDFVIYKNDLPICMGSLEQCAEHMGVKPKSIKHLASDKKRDDKIARGSSYTYAQRVPKHVIAKELGITLEEYEKSCEKYLSFGMF